MPALRNARHEAFARALVKGMTQKAAYEAAGYKPNRSHAARLVANGSISARVAELQARIAGRAVKGKADVLADLARNADVAFAKGQIAASNQSLKLYGQGLGMFVNRHPVGAKRLEDMTEAELAFLLGEGANG